MAFSKALSVLAASLLTAHGLRQRNKNSVEVASIEGVKIHKYSQEFEDFIMLFSPSATDQDISAVCKGACAFQGHPSKGGARFALVKGEQKVRKLLKANKAKVDLLESDSLDYMIPEMETQEAGIMSDASWGLGRVGVPSRTSTGKGVHIYVQDTGVRASHSDFGGRAVSTLDITSGAVEVCTETGGGCANDGQGHGTHCAGTAAGTTYGVASDAAVHAVKTLNDGGSGARSWQMMALDWMAMNAEKPAVISMSLGGGGQDPSYIVSIGAVTEAGITVVVAAGNSNDDACRYSPAFVPAAITVGATDSTDSRASYSNYGSCLDIVAPGSAIVSASARSDTGSVALSGTSMACPHVSGAAALLLETDPTMKSTEILAQMKATAKMNAISNNKADDPAEFLWVGSEPAPTVPAEELPCMSACVTNPSLCFASGCRGCSFCS